MRESMGTPVLKRSGMKRVLPILVGIGFCVQSVLFADSPEPKIAPDAAAPALAAQPSGQTSPHHVKTWRALLEDFVLWGSSTLDYWSHYGHYTVDWQFTWKTFWQKFFTDQSPRLDSNAFWYNWSHTAAGGAYYTMARINGLDSRWSTLFSFATSAMWESLSEWRELIAINDMTFTTFGGPAIGEPLFQVSSYFSRQGGIWNTLAAFITNPFLSVNNWFDHGNGPAANSAPSPDWHRFSLYSGLKEDMVTPAGTTAVDQSGAWFRQFNLGLDMETDSTGVAGTGQAERGFLPNTLSSRVFLDTSFSSAGLEEIQIRTSAVLFGWSWPFDRPDTDGPGRGGISLGYGMAFELFKKRPVAWYDSTNEVEAGGQATTGDARFDRPTPTQFTDKLSVISPLGAVLIVSRSGTPFGLRWTSALYGDFAMVNALAYNAYTVDHDTSGVKTTLLDWGYYYALGMTSSSDVAVDWRQWRVRGAATYQWYDSIQGLDRYQYLGLITNDFKIHDTRLVWRLLMGYRLAGTPIELGVAAEGIDRHGSILDIREHYSEYRYFYQFRLIF